MIARSSAAVAGGVLLNLAFGGLYGYSAMVPGLEQANLLIRTDTAMIFALSTTSFMAGVWLCSSLLVRWHIHIIALAAGAGATVGLLLCAWQLSLGALLVGYSGLYGLCVGIGYGLSLAGLAQVPLRRPGLATGIVVASFAMGSMCWAQGFTFGISHIGISATLYFSACVLAVLIGVAALILRIAHAAREPYPEVIRCPMARPISEQAGRPGALTLSTLWLTFFAVACAGLTVIGQALQLLGDRSDFAILGLSVVAAAGGANGAGRLFGGAFADRVSPIILLGIPLAGALIGLIVLRIHWNAAASYIAVILIALMYGWCSAALPAAVMRRVGEKDFAKTYARIFTAWGLAGLTAPWLAGWAFSMEGSYDISITMLSILNGTILAVLWCKYCFRPRA